jgi:isopentenyl diphosphate isomerase/L-lactate dehydrogenase-like FMN-dependent dehydrogenase
MSEDSIDRRTFVALMAAVTATACGADDPCGPNNPQNWIEIKDIESAAADQLPPSSQSWVDVEGPENRIAAFGSSMNRFALRPRVLVDVTRIDLTTTLLGQRLTSPILVAPGALRVPSARVRRDIIAGAVGAGTAIVSDGVTVTDDVSRELLFRAVHWKDAPPGVATERVLAGGVGSAEEARQAIASGYRGLIVSNALSTRASSLELVSEIRKGIPDDIALIVDGSFRHGNEILIALGLGATAVLTGWPVVWGAVATGPQGAKKTLQLLELQLVRAMRLCGRPALTDIAADLVRAAPEYSS